MTTATQNTELLALLKIAGPGGVTPEDARQIVGSNRLAARIFELKKAGIPITKRMVKTAGGALVASYRLTANPPRTCPACKREHPVGTTCSVAA